MFKPKRKSNRRGLGVALWLGGMILLAACDPNQPNPVLGQSPETPAPAAGSALPSRTPAATPTVALLTSTGKVVQVETLAGDQVRVKIAPDDPAMQAEFVIGDWSKASVLFYWAGLETPTPVAEQQRASIVKAALGHQVTIGYYDTRPPTIVLFSSHKKPGDPQR